MKYLTLLFASAVSIPLMAADLVWPTVDLAPFSSIEDGKEIGINHDFVDEISKRTALKFTMKRESKPKTLLDMRTGVGSYTFGFRNKDTDSYLDNPVCLFTRPVFAIARKGMALKKIEDLRKFKNGVGFILGSGTSNAIDGDPGIKKVSQTSYQQMFDNLEEKKIDAVVGSSMGLFFFTKQHKKEALLGDKVEIGLSDYCLLVEKSRAQTPETRKVIQAVEAMKAEGLPDKIVSKHTGL